MRCRGAYFGWKTIVVLLTAPSIGRTRLQWNKSEDQHPDNRCHCFDDFSRTVCVCVPRSLSHQVYAYNMHTWTMCTWISSERLVSSANERKVDMIMRMVLLLMTHGGKCIAMLNPSYHLCPSQHVAHSLVVLLSARAMSQQIVFFPTLFYVSLSPFPLSSSPTSNGMIISPRLKCHRCAHSPVTLCVPLSTLLISVLLCRLLLSPDII